jgi:hypothetical protein
MMLQLVDVDREFPRQVVGRSCSDAVTVFLVEDEHAVALECGGELHAKAPGQMVVAGSRLAERLAYRCFPERTNGTRRRDRRQRLDRRGHFRVCQPKVPVAAATLGNDQTALEQARQVTTRSRRRDARTGCKLAGRKVFGFDQRDKQCSPRRLADQRRCGRDIDVTLHERTPRGSARARCV